MVSATHSVPISPPHRTPAEGRTAHLERSYLRRHQDTTGVIDEMTVSFCHPDGWGKIEGWLVRHSPKV